MEENRKARANLARTLYETMREAQFMCNKCQCPVMRQWDDCPNCGNGESTDR